MMKGSASIWKLKLKRYGGRAHREEIESIPEAYRLANLRSRPGYTDPALFN
jgi:hypothetical protein